MKSRTLREVKDELLAWAAGFDYVCFLDSCETETDRYGKYEFILAVADQDAEVCHSWEALREKVEPGYDRWWFGSLTYEARTSLEPRLKSKNPPRIDFPEVCFFQAETVFFQRKGSTEIEALPSFAAYLAEGRSLPAPVVELKTGLKSDFTQAEYVATVETIRQHIYQGDCYEINLSQNFHAIADIPSPASLWRQLTDVSPTPFAAYAKFGEVHLMGASPERFLQLNGDRLLTQPIKGTAPRAADPVEDGQLLAQLRASHKDQAENVMIVDLSRNDLYRSSVVDGVSVPHLYEVQSFAKVHHLVSSVVAEKDASVSPLQAVAYAFPPGSMTGAPKVRSCELIDDYERHARGMYAGSVGYIAPGGDFDLNVVIRSMVYHAGNGVLTYQTGGAITWDSDPESEYEETLVKARAIEEVLNQSESRNIP